MTERWEAEIIKIAQTDSHLEAVLITIFGMPFPAIAAAYRLARDQNIPLQEAYQHIYSQVPGKVRKGRGH